MQLEVRRQREDQGRTLLPRRQGQPHREPQTALQVTVPGCYVGTGDVLGACLPLQLPLLFQPTHLSSSTKQFKLPCSLDLADEGTTSSSDDSSSSSDDSSSDESSSGDSNSDEHSSSSGQNQQGAAAGT